MAYVIVFVDNPQMANVTVDSAECGREIVATLVACGVRAILTDETGAEESSDPSPSGAAAALAPPDDPEAPPSSWWS